MAYTGIFATADECKYKAGLGASAVATADDYLNSFIAQAESYINVLCKTNFTTGYAALNVSVKKLLTEAASNLTAIYVIMYDSSGYSSERHAENTINVCWQRFNQCIKLLNKQDNLNFIS